MDLDALRALCLSLPAATEDLKWGHDICFLVGGKMFLVTSADESPVGASFKVPDEAFEEFCARPGCIPAPYMARHKWVYVADISRYSRQDWQEWAQFSYDAVRAKLPKKVQQQLGG